MPREPIGFSLQNARYNGLFPKHTRVVNRCSFAMGSVSSRALEGESPACLASRHSHWFRFCPMRNYSSTFLRSLRSRPITALPSYYGRSDSCPHGSSSLPGEGVAASRTEQVSLIHVPGLPIIPSPTTRCAPGTAFPRYPSARRASLAYRSGLRHSLGGSPVTPGRIEFVILRTDLSPPAALHLASWRRSCSRVSGRRAYTWRGLSPLWSSTLSGALGAGFTPARNPGESEPSGGGEPRPYEKNISRYAQLFTTLCILTFRLFKFHKDFL